MADATCSVDGCLKPARTRGLCNTDYHRWWKSADPAQLKYRRGQPKPPCSVDGCSRPRKARGLCGTHYYRWRANGDPLIVQYERPGWIVRDGYRYIWEPDHPLAGTTGYVAEHRKVVHDSGTEIPDGWHVHHINGDKLDNARENLEPVEPSEHHRHHVQEQGYVVNQYGTWPLRSA